MYCKSSYYVIYLVVVLSTINREGVVLNCGM